MPICPFFWDQQGGEEALSGFYSSHSPSVCGTRLKQGSIALLTVSQSSPEQRRWMSSTHIPSVGSEKRLHGNMKLLSTEHVTLTNTPQRPINYMVVRSPQITSLSPSSPVSLHYFFVMEYSTVKLQRAGLISATSY